MRRGDVVEAVHHVHVRASDGTAAGEDVHCFLRSSAKPIQAIPLVDAYDDVTDGEIAIAAASHQAEPAQLDAVRALLARAGATEDDLECGTQEGRANGRLGHNCSGKHAGMLATCRANGWELHPYRDLDHPLQRRIADLVAPADTATDGCGVPTFAMPLSRMTRLFGDIPPRIVGAMTAHPDLVGGQGADDTDLMRALPGWAAKRGAEGLFCARSPGGEGYVFKVEDGSTRALRPAIGQVLGVDAFRTVEMRNTRGDLVGSIQ